MFIDPRLNSMFFWKQDVCNIIIYPTIFSWDYELCIIPCDNLEMSRGSEEAETSHHLPHSHKHYCSLFLKTFMQTSHTLNMTGFGFNIFFFLHSQSDTVWKQQEQEQQGIHSHFWVGSKHSLKIEWMASSKQGKLSVSHLENIMWAKAQVNCYLPSLKQLSVDFYSFTWGRKQPTQLKKEAEMVFATRWV